VDRADVGRRADFMRGVVNPALRCPAELLKNETSRTAIPIPGRLSAELSAPVARWRADDAACARVFERVPTSAGPGRRAAGRLPVQVSARAAITTSMAARVLSSEWAP